jgi:hypothetical protein
MRTNPAIDQKSADRCARDNLVETMIIPAIATARGGASAIAVLRNTDHIGNDASIGIPPF